MLPPPPSSTLFPYTTLFRSVLGQRVVGVAVRLVGAGIDQAHLDARFLEHLGVVPVRADHADRADIAGRRSEEHTSELQSHVNLVCRLLLEKKKKNRNKSKMR